MYWMIVALHSTVRAFLSIMGRLTNEQKAKIVRLREQNTNISQIVKILGDDDCQISRLSVRRFLRRFQERQSFANAPQPGRLNEKVTPEVLNFIDAEMEKDDELTVPTLCKKLQEQFGVDFSDSKVKRLRQKLGWVQTSPKYCQLIHETNRAKQLEFCLQCLEDNEQFDDVILLMNVPSIWKSTRSFASAAGGNSRSWKDAQSIPSRYISGPAFQKEERLEFSYSQGTWMQHFTWTKSWKKLFCPPSTHTFLMVIASSKTMTLSIQAIWRKTSWLGAESTGGRHLRKALT